MKLFFSIFFLFIFCSTLVLAQNNSTLSDDSEETLLEQNLALAAENSSGITNSPPFTGLMAQVTHPLFIGVDDVTVPAYVGNVTTNEWLQAFLGYQVWGAAYDNVNDKIYFNSGTILYEYEVSSGIVTELGTITDPGGAAQSMVSLAFYDGILYGTKNIANEAVYEINTTTYVATVVIDYTDADFDFGGLAIDPNTGEFYGTNDDTSPYGSGLFRINMDGTGTLITAYPSGQTDIDGLAVSDNGIAYLVIDEPGDIFVYDLIGGTYLTPLANPWTSAETFSAGAWIYESSAMGLLLISENSTGADSVETWLNALGEMYTRVTNTVALTMPTSDWLMYDAVYYIGTTSSGAEADSCTAYCAGGGNLLVADNDEGYFVNGTPLYDDYLMSIYVSDAGSDGTITGMDIMAGLTLDISADPYPDDIMPNTGAYGTGVPIFLAPTGTTYSGMRGPGGTFRTEYLCWDPQYGSSYAENLMMY
ncbi:MAG: hypothetical protein OQK29_02890, partial [Ignavibacteriaceae bacterium]|nr:hypothetical protein [Ignavibacteriaceae bacterium]